VSVIKLAQTHRYNAKQYKDTNETLTRRNKNNMTAVGKKQCNDVPGQTAPKHRETWVN